MTGETGAANGYARASVYAAYGRGGNAFGASPANGGGSGATSIDVISVEPGDLIAYAIGSGGSGGAAADSGTSGHHHRVLTMKYAIQQSVFRSTDRVETAPFAQITVTESLSGDAASLWSDVNGITAITGNVFVADENGFFRFYVTAGQYDLEIQSDGITSNINDMVVGPSSAQSSSVQHYQGGMIHAAHRGYAAHSIENTMTSFPRPSPTALTRSNWTCRSAATACR